MADPRCPHSPDNEMLYPLSRPDLDRAECAAMDLPEHERLRRELEDAASSSRSASTQRRRVIIRVSLIGLLLGVVVVTLVLGIIGSRPEPMSPPAAQMDEALPPQTTRRESARPPATTSGPEIPPQPEPPPDAERPVTHNVRPGETLAQIALRYEVPIEQIAAENGIADPNRIRAGRELTIGAKQQGVEVIAPGSTLSEYAQRYGTTVAALMALNPQISDPDRIIAGGQLRVAQTRPS
jgi:LysM repeat protein